MSRYRIVAPFMIAERVISDGSLRVVAYEGAGNPLYDISGPLDHETAKMEHADLATQFGKAVSVQPMDG